MPKTRDKLSIKEEIFVGQMVKTKGNRTESALVAYNTKSKRNAKLIGGQLMKKPRIQEAVHEALQSKGMTIDWIISQDKKIIEAGIKEGKPTMSDARMSLESLKKLYNAYPEKVNKSISVNLKENLEREDFNSLKEQLQKLNSNTEKLLKLS